MEILQDLVFDSVSKSRYHAFRTGHTTLIGRCTGLEVRLSCLSSTQSLSLKFELVDVRQRVVRSTSGTLMKITRPSPHFLTCRKRLASADTR